MSVESKLTAAAFDPDVIEPIVMRLSAEQAGVDPGAVGRFTRYVEDLAFDSLDMVDLTLKLEDELGVHFDDDKPDHDFLGRSGLTVGDMTDEVRRRVAGRDAPR